MTKISEYPIISNPTEDDILIGTDVNSSDVTKNFSIGSIVNLVENGGRPYNVYTALLTQTGTNAPVATILENTVGNIVWSYDSTGEYLGTLTGVFISDKTYFSAMPSQVTQLKFIRINDNTVNLGTSTSGVKTNGLLSATPVEIRVYN
jgi:hypothetical protein